MYRNREDELRFNIEIAPAESPWTSPQYRSLIAKSLDQTIGSLVWRAVGSGEIEILDLTTEPAFRRRGVARSLLRALAREHSGDVLFLEVREKNEAARKLYESMGFLEIGRRRNYFSEPDDNAIVMKFHP